MSSTPTDRLRVIAIDPGTEQSAWVIFDDGILTEFGIEGNEMLLTRSWSWQRRWDEATVVAIEKVASYGMAVGEEVFQTVFWSGRFYEVVSANMAIGAMRPTRKEVVYHLCHSTKAKDANVRQALIDRFGGPDAIKKGGPLYKVAKDVWAALAVAIYAYDTLRGEP